jgi:hypothetical protein
MQVEMAIQGAFRKRKAASGVARSTRIPAPGRAEGRWWGLGWGLWKATLAQTGSLPAVSALLARHLLAFLPRLGERDGNGLLAALHPAGPAARAALGGAALVAMHFVLHFPARRFGIFSTLGHLQLRERKVRPCRDNAQGVPRFAAIRAWLPNLTGDFADV